MQSLSMFTQPPDKTEWVFYFSFLPSECCICIQDKLNVLCSDMAQLFFLALSSLSSYSSEKTAKPSPNYFTYVTHIVLCLRIKAYTCLNNQIASFKNTHLLLCILRASEDLQRIEKSVAEGNLWDIIWTIREPTIGFIKKKTWENTTTLAICWQSFNCALGYKCHQTISSYSSTVHYCCSLLTITTTCPSLMLSFSGPQHPLKSCSWHVTHLKLLPHHSN